MPLWLQTPPGRYLLAWERERIEAHVADVFGFHALQLGLGELDALGANRMPHRWLALPAHSAAHAPTAAYANGHSAPGRAQQFAPPFGTPFAAPSETAAATAVAAAANGESMRPVTLLCDFEALPFPSNSLDLVVLPHTLELAPDPHHTLREVERVLVPEGRVVVLGFNPASLWGLRQWGGRWSRRIGATRRDASPFLPQTGDFIAHRRLRDWLRLLGFEVERGGFGCYRPALRTQAWLDRWGWIEKAGDRWWPVFGAVYLMSAVKRVRGMRLIGPAWKKARAPRAAPAVVSQRRHPSQLHRTQRLRRLPATTPTAPRHTLDESGDRL